MSQNTSDDKILCQYCGQSFKIRGIGSHERACKTRKEQEAQDKEHRRVLARLRATQEIQRQSEPSVQACYCTTYSLISDAQPLPPLVIRGGLPSLYQSEIEHDSGML